ncbi:Beta-1,4-N-acetylgalactosaminyltransferase BRE-4-like protein [Daphnia magna]|uniref:Beta-1,4-N-acetylgalactosaminyltransferase BRE-4-like protein n=1 Tax=Daphnia magna TaxID=35525 RepID=A0A165AIT7_9CRUS|nr:Beta-1,4-N-acetylgalactosaminyltransferase BRE-4-like protein [Daphnia magna]
MPEVNLTKFLYTEVSNVTILLYAIRYGIAMETSNYDLAPNVIRDIVWYGYDHLVRVIAKCKNGEQSVTPATDPEATAHVNDDLVVVVSGTDAVPVPVVLSAKTDISEKPVLGKKVAKNRRTIKRKFCCLPCQNTEKIPTGEDYVQLSNLGVGLKEVSVFTDATAKELQETYPPLAGHQYVYGKSFRKTLPATFLLDMSSDMAYVQPMFINLPRLNGERWNFLGAVTAMFQRTKSQNLTVVRAFDGDVSQVVHYKTMSRPRATPNTDRMSVSNEGWKKFKKDGLVDLRYTRLSLKLGPLCTRIVVDIQPYNIST